MRSEADVVKACIDVYGDRTDRAEELLRASLDRAGRYRPWVVAVAANIQTFCDIHTMRFARARERQRWAQRFHDRTTGPFAGVYGRCFAGIAALEQLDTTGAEHQLRAAVVLARESAGRRSHAAQLAGALLGELHHVRGRLDDAERLFEEGGGLGGESGVVEFMIAGFAPLARIKAGRGAADEAAELLAEGARVADRLGLPRLRAAISAERISQLLSRGRIREARLVAQDLPDGTCRRGGIGTRIDQLRTSSLAAVYSAEGPRPGCGPGCSPARARRRPGRARGRERIVAHVGGGAATDETLPPVEQLVALFAVPERHAKDAPTDLTGREREILRMLDVGRANQQIASALGVTVNTVKWYLKNIYGKLGAGNRTEAVSVARRGGLLG